MGERDRSVAPAISVVVPARNAAATIPDTLAALGAQRLELPYEVIVVDSGSTDATPRLVSAAGVRLERNPGGEPAGSRNLGVAAASAPLIAFTDADCAPEPDWLAAGLAALARADLVQGAVVPAGPAGPYDRTVSVGDDHGLYETASLFVTRAVFDAAGGFAPVPGLGIGAGQPFGEDAWFGWRARRAGARTAFASAAVVRHAVFPRTARGWVAEHARVRYFPPLVALIPELRSGFLHRRVFLSPRSARFDLALLGVAAAARHRPLLAFALAAPYVAALRREHDRRPGAVAARVVADALTAGALAAGSVRARTPVL